MPPSLFSPLRRDLLLLSVALVLLAGPLWAPHLHLDDPTYQYSRVEITTDGTNIEYADSDAVPLDLRISEGIGCLNGQEPRICAFEELLLDGQTVPTDIYTSNPDRIRPYFNRYQFVLIDETVYRAMYVPNESVQRGDGDYRVDLHLEQVPPEQALESVSIDVYAPDVPLPVTQAARTGNVKSPHKVEVPNTPVRVANGTYYRVLRAEMDNDPSLVLSTTDFLLTYVAPIVGLGIIRLLTQRIEVNHRGEDQQSER